MMSFFSTFIQYAATRRRRAWLLVLCGVAALIPSTQSWAQSTSKGCYRITALITDKNSAYYTVPGTVVATWDGSTDTAGRGSYPMTVQINVSPFVPDGTLLGSGISSIYNLGSKGVGSYSPEQVLFRCSPDSAGQLFEYFSTNGDNPWAGKYDVSATSGIPSTYSTYFKGLISRVTNVTTGQLVTRYYQARPLTSLDTDSQGWILVKAKNFSSYKLEFFQCSACTNPEGGLYTGATGITAAGNWPVSQPVGYSVFVGPNFVGNLSIGADSATIFSTFPGSWPGAINPYGNVIVRRTATCAVINATPVIQFPPVTAAELNGGGSRQLPITIQMQCQSTTPTGMTAFVSGVAANQTALGMLAPSANVQSASTAGLTTAGSGVTYLLSDGYGTDPSVATGVGVALSRTGGGALNFLSNQYVTTGGAKDGWDAVLNDAAANGPASGGLTTYTRTINATFKAFSLGAVPVTAGSYNATAQVIIKVQ